MVSGKLGDGIDETVAAQPMVARQQSASPAPTVPTAGAKPPTNGTPTDEAPTDRDTFLVWSRRILAAGYLAVLAVFVSSYGIPLDRIGLTLWILAGLTVYSVGRGWRAFGQILIDWLPFTAVLISYDYTRGLAGGYEGRFVQGSRNDLGFPLHVIEPVDADRWMFGGQLPTSWLQEHLYSVGQIHWYDAVVTLVYITHFLATPIVAAVLWIRNRHRFRVWIGCVVGMAVLGVATYITYPMAPPWLAADTGVIEPIRRISNLGWQYLDLNAASGVLTKGQAAANPVAAMPSLHTGYAAMIALFFMVGASWWRKILLGCYPLLMGVALVYSGEHYVVDIIAGILYAGVIVGSWRLLHRWRVRRTEAASRPTETPPVVAGDPVPAPD